MKTLFLASGVLLLCLLGWALIVDSRPIPRPPLPNPNGYDDFVKAQKQMVYYYGDVTLASAKQLREHLATNAEALKLLRQGLAKECRIPIEFSTNYVSSRSLVDVKHLVWLFQADGRLAELEQRTNDAARIYLEAIRYGQESCRGGVLIDHMVGIACEALGTRWLQSVAGTLDAKSSREVLMQLREVDRRREPVADVLRNEREWFRRVLPFGRRIRAMIPIESLNPAKRVRKLFVRNCEQVELELKRLVMVLAVRAYELEHGRRPKNLNELVPDYLDAIPVDPSTVTNLTFPP